MAEPVTSTVGINLITTGVTSIGVVIFGVHTGLDYATLIAGVAGGATALSYREPANMFQRAAEVSSAALLAGYLAPGLASVLGAIIGKLPFVNEPIDGALLQLPLSWMIGYLAHGILLPGVRKMAGYWTRRYSE